MAHPYKNQARDNDPKWMKSLSRFKETEPSEASKRDVEAALRYRSGDKKATAEAAYATKVR